MERTRQMERLVDPYGPKFGMGLEIEGSSIAETAEGEPAGMWCIWHDWDSAVIFVQDAKELDP